MNAKRKTFRLGLMAYEHCMMGSLASAQDVLLVANALADVRGAHQLPRFEAVVFTPRSQRQVQSGAGLRLHHLASADDHFDAIYVPGVIHRSAAELLERALLLGPEARLLQAAVRDGVRVVFGCCSSFLFAHTGLLDGRRATTSWWLAAAFQKHYPSVRLEATAMQVDDGPMTTLGAGSATQDFVLRLIREHAGEDLANQTRKMLMLDAERQSQAPYLTETLLERPRDSLSEKAARYLHKHLADDLSVAALATHCGTTERSLLRHFRAQFNQSPREYIQHLRIERAKSLLESTQLSMAEIVERCGYLDVASFRKLFKREISMTPGEYRERFRLRASA